MLPRLGNILRRTNTSNLIRNLTLSAGKFGTKTYEGEGKTNITILNNEVELGLMINAYSQVGFRLNNDITVLGPMIIFPKSVLSWNVKDTNDITEESMSIFTILEPKLDILVVGIGDNSTDQGVFRRLFRLSKQLNITLEVLSTERACSTFNFLNSESRCVAGALIPPSTINVTDDDLMLSKMRYQKLYETDGSIY